ncbi:MAG: hypothetical protein NT007_18990 [Candidatus Kapabacteria bacterium]|nr:hypothetical protein [Candidatus Kapabacteria bacterium]
MSSLCGEHHYGNISQTKIDKILNELRKNGATISGNNPWDVDVHNNGVILRGTWNQATSTLSIIVTEKNFYVPCSKIWETIDPIINHISGLKDEDII